MRRNCSAAVAVACVCAAVVFSWVFAPGASAGDQTFKRNYSISMPSWASRFHFESDGDVDPDSTKPPNSQPINPAFVNSLGQALVTSSYSIGGPRNSFAWGGDVSGKWTLTVRARSQIKNFKYWFDAGGST